MVWEGLLKNLVCKMRIEGTRAAELYVKKNEGWGGGSYLSSRPFILVRAFPSCLKP